jgi:uncharacterized protein YeeX (DUF496 family)
MTLREVIKALDDLSDEELNELRREIDLRTEQEELRSGTMDVDALLRAAADLTDGLTQDEIDAMVAAMNEEYIEPVDEDVWRD